MTTAINGALNSEKRINGATALESSPIELSVVMPCLNEADTLESCIKKAQMALRESRIPGEMPELHFGRVRFDVHTLLFANLAILCGYQSILFAIFTKAFAVGEGLVPEDRQFDAFFRILNLERGLILAVGAVLVGTTLLLMALNQWREVAFGALDYTKTMRFVAPGITLTALGFQTILSSFFVSILGMRRR